MGRGRELPVKANFPSAYDNILCFYPACTSEDSQKHIFESECFSSGNEIGKENTNYSEIFSGNVRSRVSVMNILFSKLKERERYMALTKKSYHLIQGGKKPQSLGLRRQ